MGVSRAMIMSLMVLIVLCCSVFKLTYGEVPHMLICESYSPHMVYLRKQFHRFEETILRFEPDPAFHSQNRAVIILMSPFVLSNIDVATFQDAYLEVGQR